MAKKEMRISHDRLRDPSTITQVQEQEFQKAGLDVHKNEIDELVDDHSRQERIYKIRSVKYFGPWSKRG